MKSLTVTASYKRRLFRSLSHILGVCWISKKPLWVVPNEEST